MKLAQEMTPPSNGYEIFNDFEALTTLVQKSFMEAAKAAVAENNRLGIPTHGSFGLPRLRLSINICSRLITDFHSSICP
jgi:hypothetical protein